MEVAIPLAVPVLVAGVSYKKKWLTPLGSVAGLFVASAIVLTGFAETLALLLFFLLGTLATKLSDKEVAKRSESGDDKKKEHFTVVSYETKGETDAKKGRNALQVLATAGIPALLCVVLNFVGFEIYDINIASLYFAYFACDMADTLASEVGVLSTGLPVKLTTLRKVPRGTDGGISFEGTIASIVGGSIIGLVASLSKLSIAHSTLENILKFAFVGFLGSLVDSLLGCFLQKEEVMKKSPSSWKIRNTFVNLISGTVTLAVDVVFQFYTWPSIFVSIAISSLLLLFLSPMSKPFARKALHILISLLITVASNMGHRKLIGVVALFAAFLSLPQSNLQLIWDRFRKKQSGPKDTGIFFYALTTGFVFYYFPSNLAQMVMFPMYFSDPIAALIGSHFPSTIKQPKREHKPIVSKTMRGTFSFAVVTFVAFQYFLQNNVTTFNQNIAISLNLALIELLSGSLDNLFLPVSMLLFTNIVDHGQQGFSFLHLAIFTICGLLSHIVLFNADISKSKQGFDAFKRFTRPHTIIGTSLSIVVVMMITIFNNNSGINFEAVSNDNELLGLLVYGLSITVLSALQANVYIVGLNQMYDIEIDVINKPYLPVASGEFSEEFGWNVVFTCFFCSLANAYVYGNEMLFWTVAFGSFLGTIYSVHLPFLHWKRFPILAALLIFVVRGGLVQIGFAEYSRQLVNENSKYTLGSSMDNNFVMFLSIFLTFFGAAIALFKDVPDIAGDEEEGIRTFAVRFGARKVVNVVNFLLGSIYSAAALYWFEQGNVIGTVGHLAVYCLLGMKLNATIVSGKEAPVSIRASYMAIWKAFYAEYLLVAAVFALSN